MLALVFSLVAALMAASDVVVPASAPAPTWAPAADETVLPGSPLLDTCERLIDDVAHENDLRVGTRRYTRSPRWGPILRAELVTPDAAAAPESRITCWTGGRHHLQVSLTAPDVPPPPREPSMTAVAIDTTGHARPASPADGPSWSPTQDEKAVPDSARFQECDRLVAAVAQIRGWRITLPRYALSQRWGHVLRVMLLPPHPSGDLMFEPLSCWQAPGAPARILAWPNREAPDAPHVTVDSITPPAQPPPR